MTKLREKELDYLSQIEKLKLTSHQQVKNNPPRPIVQQSHSPPPVVQIVKARDTSGFDFDAMSKTIELLRWDFAFFFRMKILYFYLIFSSISNNQMLLIWKSDLR